jgi:hypothetical protein
MSATKTLAQFIVDTRYELLPAPVVDAAKVAILDGVEFCRKVVFSSIWESVSP